VKNDSVELFYVITNTLAFRSRVEKTLQRRYYSKKTQERNDNLKLFLSNAVFGGEVGAPFKFSPLGLALWPYLQISYFVGKGLPGTNTQAYWA
jgi:hypothetical protein